MSSRHYVKLTCSCWHNTSGNVIQKTSVYKPILDTHSITKTLNKTWVLRFIYFIKVLQTLVFLFTNGVHCLVHNLKYVLLQVHPSMRQCIYVHVNMAIHNYKNYDELITFLLCTQMFWSLLKNIQSS